MERPDYRAALRQTGMMTALAGFDPHLAGTLPLGLDVPTSDLDVLCHAPDPDAFAAALWAEFSDEADFAIRQRIEDDRPVIASFTARGWPFQIFGQATPVEEQNGWRHFLIERRLLKLGGSLFRAAIVRERASGAKTEPAFATVLRLAGDPYRALLDLEQSGDGSPRRLLKALGFEI